MMNNVPTAIQEAAKGLIEVYGQHFAYLGQYKGRAPGVIVSPKMPTQATHLCTYMATGM